MDGGMPVAVVTGANRGVGFVICRQLAERGFAVVLGARDEVKGEQAAQQLDDAVAARRLDVADQASVDAAAAWVAERYGRCDALVNNAAIHYDIDARARVPTSAASSRRWKPTSSAHGAPCGPPAAADRAPTVASSTSQPRSVAGDDGRQRAGLSVTKAALSASRHPRRRAAS
jgi:NAD(P)-dependent dehydrogenase (short-subunit alcohol dehydrogenase family)